MGIGICHSVATVTASVDDTACSAAPWHPSTAATKSFAIADVCRDTFDTFHPGIGAWRALGGRQAGRDGLAGRCGNIVAVVEWAYVASRAIQIQADGGGAGDQHKRQQTEPQPAIRLMRWL